MSNALERGLHAIELLAGKNTGLALQQVAEALDIPPSATHRMLNCLVEQGFVRQDPLNGNYVLALKVVSLALKHLSQSNVVDLSKPILEGLARVCGELVRLSIVDGDQLVWISKAQGTRSGLRYDPDAGAQAKLCCTASGLAWLSCLSNERALELVYRQGLAKPGEYGPNAATTIEQLLDHLQLARDQGYACVDQTFEIGAAAMAAAIRDAQGNVIGVISIAGPSIRLTPERIHALKAALFEATEAITAISLDSLPKLTTLTSQLAGQVD